MNLNEQLQQAYNAGRRQGLNEQGIPSVPVPGLGPVPFIAPAGLDSDPFPPVLDPPFSDPKGLQDVLRRYKRQLRDRDGLGRNEYFDRLLRELGM